MHMPDATVCLMAQEQGSEKHQELTKVKAECNGHHTPNEVLEDPVDDEDGPTELRTKSILKKEGSGDLKDEKLKRTVSWHDFSGKELHTVREFVPSEHDAEEYLYQPEKKGACCVIC